MECAPVFVMTPMSFNFPGELIIIEKCSVPYFRLLSRNDPHNLFGVDCYSNSVAYIKQQQKLQRQERAERRNTAIARTKKWVPFMNVKDWDTIEKCLLEMLPVRNLVFRRLQDLIEEMETFPANDSEGWKLTLLDCLAVLSFLDSKRAILEPLFNQEDPTELYISKSSLGERIMEALRARLEDLITIASGDVDLVAYRVGGRATVNSEAETSSIAGRRARKRSEDDATST
eukprot:CAMPEP_0172570730 /NCGR_PEP_ID=MMETSP1067-20121228/128644_1 /TAXON_ID=265564 ORGANISM="Thalassiosira punctigera, Strain Tpunct2005C2" /NCGR_SAMPLE_ID=MMETSP1067 /ASSEMBLY_ACC=CAM_ASM_000444 /LENGTH=229 /DNA_ID=CAMNT_0013362885 /DNA_START=62 /DNA_END=748 /DNA_ORIENTATION=+